MTSRNNLKLLTFWCPPDLADEFTRLGNQLLTNRTALIIQAMKEFLETNPILRAPSVQKSKTATYNEHKLAIDSVKSGLKELESA